jgi:DNA-directed RNA polymerase, mitochondrial
MGSSLLEKLAAREQTTSNHILHSVTKSDAKEPEAIGPLTSTEELLEALDLGIDSDEKDPEELESASIEADIQDGDNVEVINPKKRKRRTKKEKEMDIESMPKFVELTKLLPPVPKKGNFEVNTVKGSLYFFS